MADPATLAIIAASAAVIGTGVSAYGQWQSGEAQKKAYKYQSRVSQIEAAETERLHRVELKRMMASQRALYAKAGVDISSGSPLLVMSETAAEGERIAHAIRRGGISKAELESYYGRASAYAGRLGGASTFLTGLGQTGLLAAPFFAKKS